MRECKLLFPRKKWLLWKNSQKHHVCIAAYFRFASINFKKFYVENQGFLKFYPMVKSACPYLNPSGNDSVPKMTLLSKAEWMKKLTKIISDSGFLMRPHISIRGCVRPSVGPSVRRSVGRSISPSFRGSVTL